MSWPQRALGPLCLKIGSGVTPRGGDAVYLPEGVSLIRSQNVYNSHFAFDGLAHITDEQADAMSGAEVTADDVLLNITGDSVARCCRAPKETLPARVNQHVSIIRPDPALLEADFLCYFLTSPFMQSRMLSLAGSGGTRKALTKGMIEKFSVPLPQLDVQKSISMRLRSYDDLTANNQRRIKLLEQSARLLFREWFVYLRYPGHEHDTVTNGVPRGWFTRKFADLVDFKEGPGLRNYQYREQGIPFLNIRTFGDDEIDLSKTQHLDENEVATKYERFLVEEDDHVVSSSGTLGRVVTIRKCHLPLMLNTSVIRMRPKPPMTKWFLKAYLKHGAYLQSVTAMATGAAQLNYGPMHLKTLEVLMPGETLVQVFEDVATPIYTQIKTLLDTNMRLQRARDLLLPRLMDGRLSV